MSNTHHLDRDPNDPRNLVPAAKLPSLNEVPEATLVEPKRTEVKNGNSTLHLGKDPNDSRLVAGAK